jgi:hypothetical protein
MIWAFSPERWNANLGVPQGPEGRPPNVSPAREGWESMPTIIPERRRRGTVLLPLTIFTEVQGETPAAGVRLKNLGSG